MAENNIPKRYDDPYWVNLAADTEKKLELPEGSLRSILLNGERSNADQVSSAGAKTPFQVIPQTRKAILDKYGVDAYLNPENAAEAAGLVLKEGLDRNGGNLTEAVGEYIGGTNRSNWGKVTKSYIDRVMTGLSNIVPAAQAGTLDSFESQLLDVYRQGKMSPEDAQAFEAAIQSGEITLPQGESFEQMITERAGNVQISYPADSAGQNVQGVQVPQEIVDAYTSGRMTPEDRAVFEQAIQSGELIAPQGLQAQPTTQPEMGFFEGLVESVTGEQRATPESRTLPEWTSMPELNQMSVASFKTALGTMLSNPQETVQILQANFPGVEVRQDAKGNFIMRSPTDQQEYVIPPGFSMGDIPRAIGGIAAFTPAGRVASIPMAGLAAGGTQAAIEATQALAGGEISPTEIALATGFGAGGQALARGAGALAQGVRRGVTRQPVAPRVEPTIAPAEAPSFRQPAAPVVEPTAPPAVPPVAQTTPEAAQEVAETIRKASGGGIGSSAAQAKLADLAQVNAEARAAAERLGLDLPFDVFADNPQVRAAVGLTRSIAGGEAEAAWINTLRNATNRADEVIQQFDAAFIEGRPSTAVVSEQVLNSLKKTRQTIDDTAKGLYNQVDESISKSAVVEMPNLNTTMGQIVNEVGEAGLTAQEKRLLTMLDGEITYGRLLREKNLIGKAIAGKESPYGSLEEASLKRLYAALAQDQLDAVADVAGDEVRRQLRAANLLTAQKKALENRIVSAYGKEMDGSIATLMQSALTRAAKGDAGQFNKLMKVVPDELRKDVVATALAEVSSSRRAVNGGAFGFAEFTKVYRGLRANPQVYSQVVKTLGKDSDKVMRDLYEVSKRITDARAQVLTTGKANQALVDSLTAEGIVGKVMKSSLAQRGATGAASLIPGAGVFAPDIIKLMSQGGKDRIKAAADLFANSDFQKMVVEAATKGTPTESSIRKTAMSKPFNEFAKKNGIGKSLEAKIQWLTTAAQTGRQFETESE